MTSLCLAMIVKDEAPVIRRCLASVRPILSRWIVVDTGSTDGTQAIVREAMVGLPGALVERPRGDFAHNRSEALALARPHAAYSLVIDADDELVLPPGFALPALEADSYAIEVARRRNDLPTQGAQPLCETSASGQANEPAEWRELAQTGRSD